MLHSKRYPGLCSRFSTPPDRSYVLPNSVGGGLPSRHPEFRIRLQGDTSYIMLRYG